MTPFVVRELHADLETPVSAYLKLRSLHAWSFLFESVEGRDQWANYSILGVGARHVFQYDAARHGADPLAYLQHAYDKIRVEPPQHAPSCVGGIFGFLSYTAVQHFEPVPQRHSTSIPEALFFEPEVLAVFDHKRYTLTLYAQDASWIDRAEACMRAPLPNPEQVRYAAWREPQALDTREAFLKHVGVAQEHIRAGDLIQIVLSRRFDLAQTSDVFDVYRGLRKINPSPYMYMLRCDDLQIAGASPEVMVRVQEGNMLVRPIAGTRPRGSDAEHDAALAAELMSDPKERAEHVMLVDLGRNDVGRVSVAGSVSVPECMVIEPYSHVMHMVSQVQGRLLPHLSAFDALRAAFPAGTLSGAPKVRAMQIIDQLEQGSRGIYGGAIGYFGPHGNADVAIAIRTLVAEPHRWTVQAGAGIVYDSDPSKEADETEHKARAVIRAAQWAAEVALCSY